MNKNILLFMGLAGAVFFGNSLIAENQDIFSQESSENEEDDAQQEIEKYLAENPKLSSEKRENLLKRLGAVSTQEYKNKEKFEREELNPLYYQLRDIEKKIGQKKAKNVLVLEKELKKIDKDYEGLLFLDEIIREKYEDDRANAAFILEDKLNKYYQQKEATIVKLVIAREKHMKLADEATSTPAYKVWYKY